MRKALVIALLVLPLAASADVIYDSLNIANNQLYDSGNGNWIGGISVLGANSDLQLADNFTLSQNMTITDVTFDFVTFGVQNPGTAMVEIFQNVGGVPSNSPVYSATVGANVSNWNDTLFFLSGRRVHASVNAPLAAGNYFVSLQGISGDWGYTVRDLNNPPVDSYGRDAGGHHGNGYQGGYGTTNWVSMNSLGYGAGDSSMKIEGVVPEPASLLLLGLATLLRRR